MTEPWKIAGDARRDFADMIEGLDESQLAASTFCEGWNAKQVAGHLVSFVELSLPAMMLSMAKGGFNPDKAWTANAIKFADQPIADIARKLRDHAEKPSPIKSFPAELTITDVVIHTQDVRRPLGLDGAPSPDAVRAALDFCTAHAKGKMMVDPKHISGLRLEATDMDWSWGDGDLVSGPAEAVLLGINRRQVQQDLTGDGVAKLPK